MTLEERKKRLEEDQAAFEEEERVRLELEQRLEALRVQREQLLAEGKLPSSNSLSQPVSVPGCDPSLQQALVQAFGQKHGVAIATCFVKEEVGSLKTAMALSQNDVREVLLSGNFDESYLARACDAIAKAQEIVDARPQKTGVSRACSRVCTSPYSPKRASGEEAAPAQPSSGLFGVLFKKSSAKEAATA